MPVNKKKILYILIFAVLIICYLLFFTNNHSVTGIVQRLIVISIGYIATLNDLKEKRVPNKLVLIMLGLWPATLAIGFVENAKMLETLLFQGLFGAVVIGAMLLFLYICSRKQIGGGDIKFMIVAALYLGFDVILTATLFGSILASVFAVALLLLKKIDKKGTIPLIPFLYTGILLVLAYT